MDKSDFWDLLSCVAEFKNTEEHIIEVISDIIGMEEGISISKSHCFVDVDYATGKEFAYRVKRLFFKNGILNMNIDIIDRNTGLFLENRSRPVGNLKMVMDVLCHNYLHESTSKDPKFLEKMNKFICRKERDAAGDNMDIKT